MRQFYLLSDKVDICTCSSSIAMMLISSSCFLTRSTPLANHGFSYFAQQYTPLSSLHQLKTCALPYFTFPHFPFLSSHFPFPLFRVTPGLGTRLIGRKRRHLLFRKMGFFNLAKKILTVAGSDTPAEGRSRTKQRYLFSVHFL